MKTAVLSGVLLLCLCVSAQANVVVAEACPSLFAADKVLWGMPEGDMSQSVPGGWGWLAESTSRGYLGLPFIIFDLTNGAAELRTLNSVAITGHGGSGFGASEVQVLYSADASWYGPGKTGPGGSIDTSGFVSAGTFAVDPYGTTLITLGVAAQWVEIIVTKDQSGSPTPASSFVGYRSADFTTSPVPEPATMGLLGLGLAGLALRRNKK